MTFDKREELISLYDVYGVLLTDKQKSYFEEYYFDDLSFSEIALNHGISRNGVFDQNKRVANILALYEDIKLKDLLKSNKKNNKFKSNTSNLINLIENFIEEN